MSTTYRTTVRSWRHNEEEVFINDTLHNSMFQAELIADVDDQIIVDEVIQDASGQYELVYPVLEYVKEAD